MPQAGSTALPFPGRGYIALIVRGKTGRDHAPWDNGHADVILPSGAPAGFFGHPTNRETGYAGFEIPGWVFGYNSFSAYRPEYVNLADARAHNVISGVLIIGVTAEESRRFQRAWQEMRARPGLFTIVGNNCATHAARAFAQAGLVNRELSGIDTPDGLFRALLSRNPDRCRDEYGYLGFQPRLSAGQCEFDQFQMDFDVGMDAANPVPPSARTSPRLGLVRRHGG